MDKQLRGKNRIQNIYEKDCSAFLDALGQSYCFSFYILREKMRSVRHASSSPHRLYMLRLSVLGETGWCNALVLSPTPMGWGIGVDTFLDTSPLPSVNELK